MLAEIRHTVILGCVLVAVALTACGDAPDSAPEPTPDIEATVQARLNEERATEATIEAKAQVMAKAMVAKAQAMAKAMVDATAQAVPTATPIYTPSKPYVFEVLDKHPTIECLNENMDVFINVFGLYVISNQLSEPGRAMHTANILAEYIDNDMNGAPDDDAVLNHLIEQNFVVPVWTMDIRKQFWEDARGTFCEDNISMAASLYDDDDWAIGGIKYTGTFDANLEEVWHVVSRGWYAAYPEYFGNSFDTESILTQAMDIARGGKFYDTPSEYPAGAWYKYSDESCTYSCQISEYFYWAVMANIGALDTSITNKCYPDKGEWNICTKSELEAKDKKIYDLLNNKGFNLPTNIPTGGYKISSE